MKANQKHKRKGTADAANVKDVHHPSQIPASHCTFSDLKAVEGYDLNALHYELRHRGMPALRLRRTPNDTHGMFYVDRDAATAFLQARAAARAAPPTAPTAPVVPKVTDVQILDAIGRLIDKVDALCFDVGTLRITADGLERKQSAMHETLENVADTENELCHKVSDLRTLVECLDSTITRQGDHIDTMIEYLDSPGLALTGGYDDGKEVRANG